MIIGFDGSRAFVKGRTGTENYSYQLLKALSKIDHQNLYIIYLRPGTQGLALRGWPKNFKFQILNFKFLWTQAGLAAQTFTDPLDVLFIPAHTSPLIHKKGLKTVVTVHDLGSEYLPKMHQLKQRLYLKWITKFQLKTATKLIAVSQATKEDLIKKVDIDSKKVTVVYEGFDKKLFKPIKADILVDSLIPYFLFVGTIQPRKNLEMIIKAFAEYVKVTSFAVATRRKPSSLSPLVSNLVIAGSKGWLSEQIYQLPKKLGIEDRVKFLGYVEDKNLPALYSAAIALVFPSLFEGFGLPILEAQACGCPVITSGAGSSPKDVSSMPEVAGKGAIYVNPYSVNDIVRGMREIEEMRDKLIKLGFENIKRFSWEKCAKETLEVLEEVLKQ